MTLMKIAIVLALYKKYVNPRTSVAIVKDDLGRVLLLRRSKTDDWMPNHWALPGGHIDFFESSKGAVVRELEEETNLKALRVQRIPSNKKRDAFFFVSNWAGQVDLDKASHGFEHSEYVWIHPDDIPQLDFVVPTLKTKKNINLLKILG